MATEASHTATDVPRVHTATSGWRSIAFGAVLGILACASVSAEQPSAPAFALKAADKVVFYGDSITAQRLYTRFVEDFVVSRYPQMRIEFYNAGVSGDTVEGGHAGSMETRVKRDVLPWRPECPHHHAGYERRPVYGGVR